MSIVIDANVFNCVFDEKSADHLQFKPVLNWILRRQGFLVYGGTKHKRELCHCIKSLGVLKQLKDKGLAKEVSSLLVDRDERVVIRLVNTPKCDDPHIIALFRVSGCLLFCSNDKRADCYIKNPRFYPQGQKPPSIYRKALHRTLLIPRNVVSIRNLA